MSYFTTAKLYFEMVMVVLMIVRNICAFCVCVCVSFGWEGCTENEFHSE